ncbi:MAG: hypothetical protein ACYSR0_09565 [Planctomycetota bacterium]|jgi:hypothetical protein
MPWKTVKFEAPEGWYVYFREVLEELRTEKLDKDGKAGGIFFEYLLERNEITAVFIPSMYADPIIKEIQRQKRRYRKNELARIRRRQG